MTHDRNKNRPGYKKTKVGWIPVGWNCVQAEQKFSIQLGKMLSGKARIGNNPQPYLANYNVRWGHFDLTSVQSMDFSEREKDKFLLIDGDLLVCEGGEVARCAVWHNQIAPCYYQKALHRVRPLSNDVSVKFTMYYLHHAANLPHMVHYIGETSIAHFTREKFLKFPIPLPPLPEQQKIAEILSTWDAAIERTRKLVEAKKRRKKALMQQLLTGKIRLPQFGDVFPREKFKYFDLPKDWQAPKVAEIGEECSERNKNGDALTVLSCSKYKGFVESLEYFGKQVHSSDTSNYKIVRNGWFGYPANHIEEGSIGLLSSHEVGIVSPIYTVFRTYATVVPEYLYAVFKSETFRHVFAVTTNSSVNRRGSLRWKQFAQIQVPLPAIAEQRAIAEVLETADKEIRLHESELAALEKQKRGLMQKLLTGEVRVYF